MSIHFSVFLSHYLSSQTPFSHGLHDNPTFVIYLSQVTSLHTTSASDFLQNRVINHHKAPEEAGLWLSHGSHNDSNTDQNRKRRMA